MDNSCGCENCECKANSHLFKLKEDEYLNEIKAYILETYSGHYAKTNRQTIESIIERNRR